MCHQTCEGEGSSKLRRELRLRANLHACSCVVVVLQLQIIVVAIPHLISLSTVPITGGAAKVPRTEVADFLAVGGIPPGIPLRIGGSLGDFVAGNANVGVRRNVAARRMLIVRGSRTVAVRGVSVGLICVNGWVGGAAEKAMVGAIPFTANIGAGR